MIQRKQTLFLLAVAIIGIIMLFVPLFNYSGDTHDGSFNIMNTTQSVSSNYHLILNVLAIIMNGAQSVFYSYYPLVLNIIVIILSIAVIFLYKNRILQYKLANLLILLNVFIVGLFFLLPYAKEGDINYEFGAFLPIIGAVFAFLAGHFIKKDEQLVRNSDRIR